VATPVKELGTVETHHFSMSELFLQSSLRELLDAERASRWDQTPAGEVAKLLEQVAELFFVHGDALASETAERMGVTPGEVWLEVIFPSVWGILSTRRGILANCPVDGRLQDLTTNLPQSRLTQFAGHSAIKVLPANKLEAWLLPEFKGYVVLRDEVHDAGRDSRPEPADNDGCLALCLLPFNLASIGALDIIHLLCRRQRRVIAKISEKVEFVGSYLERVFEPLLKVKAVQFVYGGPDVGAWLAARREFSHIHLTGSARTAAAVEQVAGREKVTAELGGVTAAIIFPDALSSRMGLQPVARQVAFGALANNGQHCVSFQVAVVPQSQEALFADVLWDEMTLATRRNYAANGSRMVVDVSAAKRLETLVADLAGQGARVKPAIAKASRGSFPTCLIRNINEKMRIFRDEAFGPVLGLLPVPDDNFAERALALANSRDLSGDLGISLFTLAPDSPEVEQMAAKLRHGMVMINTYPGVAFATSVPWGAGLEGASGRGWVHNYGFLPETCFEKVVISTSLGRKGFGPLRWEDPWLLNVTGNNSVKLARALVRAALAYFRGGPSWEILSAQLSLVSAIARREWVARVAERRS
jgi:acyl-CoA reductase-like NAD-dependent aldehyde dehydrogenase